ncbi:flagellar basal body P-ring protein [uncultured Desulfobacterium sp.]|uniref:Flagellar P-ring protein n=1 Tax=uncultured Desulfobacterium sp. TaxID=201089 RepID=A0A445MTH6_9BACT|nr:flagellar basal body P-ring protein [uncultured Desulfobacterium sp.]
MYLTHSGLFSVDELTMCTIKRKILAESLFCFLALAVSFRCAYGVRIKDIADIEGVRKNQLVGYGLVIGLDGTGDGNKSEFTIKSISSMLERMGVTIDPARISVKNVAAVMVTADLPPFSKPGGKIDANVSSIGDAKSLYGGTLLFTPLKGANGNTYAVAQGPIVIGGFSAAGSDASVQKNFPTVGRIIGGALVEDEVSNDFERKESLSWSLHSPDFTTVSRVAEAINSAFYDKIAFTPNSGTIEVKIPQKYIGNLVELVTVIEGLEITPDEIAKVVINERTGTVIVGKNVKISTTAIAHGNLSIAIKESADVSQPLPFSNGQTTVTPNTNMSVKEGKNKLMLMDTGVSIEQLVKALNSLGVSPRDLITIFQALRASGALRAELETI